MTEYDLWLKPAPPCLPVSSLSCPPAAPLSAAPAAFQSHATPSRPPFPPLAPAVPSECMSATTPSTLLVWIARPKCTVEVQPNPRPAIGPHAPSPPTVLSVFYLPTLPQLGNRLSHEHAHRPKWRPQPSSFVSSDPSAPFPFIISSPQLFKSTVACGLRPHTLPLVRRFAPPLAQTTFTLAPLPSVDPSSHRCHPCTRPSNGGNSL